MSEEQEIAEKILAKETKEQGLNICDRVIETNKPFKSIVSLWEKVKAIIEAT